MRASDFEETLENRRVKMQQYNKPAPSLCESFCED